MQTECLEVLEISNGKYYSNKMKNVAAKQIEAGQDLTITVATSEAFLSLGLDTAQVADMEATYIVLEGDAVFGAYLDSDEEFIDCFVIDTEEDLEDYLSYV